ncbi:MULTISPECIES: hypothetical protein [Halobacterium]|uniref:hypothetical protein n=1 Tax=Halobacterium TaxID=2239 RepID=UPI00073F8D8A|nr:MULTISPECIES: hypothetical protein [Halobacterium]MCG1003289.1 hypothetical protein [Halobacterium noricense]
MTRRFRWTRAAPNGSVTVTRVAGDHELEDGDPQRRYTLSVPAAPDATVVAVTGCTTTWEDDTLWVTVSDGAGLARVRLRTSGAHTAFRFPGPTFDDRLTVAIDGDEAAARELLANAHSPVVLVLASGPFLGVEEFVSLVDALATASEGASDDLHATRYDLVRIAATTAAGPPVATAEDFEALADGLDAVDAIGNVTVLDALAGATAVAHDTPAETKRFLSEFGYELPLLAERDDGRFLAHYLAQVARTAGIRDAKQAAARRAANTDHAAFEDAKAAAERADYWDRGAAWRDAVLPAAGESFPTFAYVLANALYWTGEVGRSDSRADELLHEGAAAAARSIDLEWVPGHADYERARAAAHRHRSKRNHALALENFAAAREVAESHSFLDPWEPTYSHAVVESNALSTAGDHERAVAVLDEALATLREQGVPEDRFEEMRDHLAGQRHERRAIVADDDSDRLAHLEAALDHYESVAFERSVARIEAKLDDAEAGEDATAGEEDSGGRARPQPVLRPDPEAGPSLDDIPSLHDSLTETDPGAVGSADPGVLPDERGDALADDPGVTDRDSDPYYR